MKLKLCACLLLGALAFVARAVPASASAPFLSVDIQGTNSTDDTGQPAWGPLEAGYQEFKAAEGLFLDSTIDWVNSGAVGLTNSFTTSEGSITANLKGVGTSLGARNRGGNSDINTAMTQDFVFVQRDNAIAFGRNYVKLTLSGLAPSTTFAVTTFARDHFNGGGDSFQAWSDISALGGLDGPSAWLDANVEAGASYQPEVGGVNNPIPTLARSAVSGPAAPDDPYAYAATFLSSSDASGVLTLYGWADPNSFSGVQGATLLNGFQLAAVPEPGSLILFAFAVAGVAFRRIR
jgi:hypothetical protein